MPALSFGDASRRLIDVGRRFDARGWVLGTSGNFSVVLEREPLRLAITSSGTAKGDLTADDTIEIDGAAQLVTGPGKPPGVRRPSAEALLHLEIVRCRGAAAVLHTHSTWSTLLSDRFRADEGLAIEGYEMLKGLEGVTTHAHREWVPILDNDQDMSRLGGAVRQALRRHPAAHAFLLHRHGMYTWGDSLPQAVRHVEIVEFLLEAVARAEEVSSWPSSKSRP
jgi:methylthioribulose-1-phosphate dehydratase